MIKKYLEAILSTIAIIVSCFAILYSYNANKIAKENFNPYFKIEYLTVKGYIDFTSFWNSPSTDNKANREDIGIDKILCQIETENLKIVQSEELFKKYLKDQQLDKKYSLDYIFKNLEFEIVHIKNVSTSIAKNVKFKITEAYNVEVVNEYPLDVASSNESIILLSKVFFVNDKNDTLIIGPRSMLEKIRYDGYDTNLERKNRERFKGNRIIRCINGSSLIAQCPFIYSNQSDQWILENAIIVGCDNKMKEKITHINLSNFNGRIKILEIEKETSFIDQLFVQVIYNNNDTIIYRPTKKSLIEDDKSYLVLDQHESIIIDFTPNFTSGSIKEITLFAKGFYEPYSFGTSNDIVKIDDGK